MSRPTMDEQVALGSIGQGAGLPRPDEETTP